MSDQNQQQPGQAQSGTTQTSPSQETSLANAGQNKPFNPWEGEPDHGEGQTGGVGAEGQEGSGQGGGASQGASSQSTQGGQAGTQAATTATSVQPQGLTAEAISDIVSKTVGATVAASQPKPQQQFTEEDFRRTFQVFEPTPEILASVGLPATPESAQAFAKITSAIVRQAVTMSAYQLEKLKQEMTEYVKTGLQPYEPARQMAQERVEQQMKTEFLDQNPDLKGFEPLLEEIKDRLISQGTKFKSKDDVFKTIAEHARTIIKQIPGVGQAASGQTQPTQQSTNANSGGASHRMSGLSGSGQGGVGTSKGGTGGAAKKKSTAEALFG